MSKSKPLFIPLKRKYYERFINGQKQNEMRLDGPRWNDKTCFPGREVILSLGYGKYDRVKGMIRDSWVIEKCFNSDFVELYGPDKNARIINIAIYPNTREQL